MHAALSVDCAGNQPPIRRLANIASAPDPLAVCMAGPGVHGCLLVSGLIGGAQPCYEVVAGGANVTGNCVTVVTRCVTAATWSTKARPSAAWTYCPPADAGAIFAISTASPSLCLFAVRCGPDHRASFPGCEEQHNPYRPSGGGTMHEDQIQLEVRSSAPHEIKQLPPSRPPDPSAWAVHRASIGPRHRRFAPATVATLFAKIEIAR